MIITIDTHQPLTEEEASILRFVLGEHALQAEKSDAPPQPAPKNKHQKQEESSAAAIEEIDAEEFDTRILDDAVTHATALLAKGKREEVKAALKKAGVTRATELTIDNVNIFMEALDE